MPIRVECACGARLGVADEAAGKRVRCPKCAGVLDVPGDKSIYEEFTNEAPRPNEPPRVPCPYCAAMILPYAKICRHCQSPLGSGPERCCLECGAVNSALVARCRSCGSDAAAVPSPRTAVAGEETNRLQIIDWILGLLLPCFGLFLGVIHITNGRAARGGKLIGLSLIVLFLGASCHMATTGGRF